VESFKAAFAKAYVCQQLRVIQGDNMHMLEVIAKFGAILTLRERDNSAARRIHAKFNAPS
jgi:hypothetical protein